MIEIDSIPLNIVSYSELFKFQTCQRQYYYRFILGLRSVEESKAIATGVKGHKLLENFYLGLNDGLTKEEAKAAVAASAMKLMAKQGVADVSLLPAYTLVDNYINSTEFNAEAILVENRFRIPAVMLTDDPYFEDLEIGFTPDLVLKRSSGFIDVEDYKFVQRAWSAAKIKRYQQSKLYHIFLEAMGYKVSRSVIRFFNVQTGTITDRPYTMTAAAREILLRDFFKGIKEVLEFRRQNLADLTEAPRTMNYTACHYCAFEFACDLEAEGKDASRTLQTQFVKSDYSYAK
jgi:CRISPR/Cas system-associated exonuclease Cas4 (RecB family)